MVWSRPPGPPRVWRDIELGNCDGKHFQFSIQEIPDDRYTEVLDHMCTSFVEEETILGSIKISEDPDSLAVLRSLWTIALQQGVSVAAFETNGTGETPKLAGLNILAVSDDQFDELCKSYDISKLKAKSFFEFISNYSVEVDPRKIFNVDLYLNAFGLSVLPKYRGLGLAKYLLEARNDIGELYNISVTETLFTSIISQKIAETVGFQVYLDRAYEDIVDEEGKKVFPLLTGKRVKTMMKQLV